MLVNLVSIFCFSKVLKMQHFGVGSKAGAGADPDLVQRGVIIAKINNVFWYKKNFFKIFVYLPIIACAPNYYGLYQHVIVVMSQQFA